MHLRLFYSPSEETTIMRRRKFAALLYLWCEKLLGERVFIDTTLTHPREVNELRVETYDEVELVVRCQKRHYQIRYARFGIVRNYVQYYVSSFVGGNASERFQRAADFTIEIPATYPSYLDGAFDAKVAVEHYIHSLEMRLHA